MLLSSVLGKSLLSPLLEYYIGPDITCLDIKTACVCRENREMKAAQARASVEVAREVNNDKSLKSRAEKDRRLREKHSNNTKIFIDERKTAAMRQDKRREKLKKIHENQMSDLTKYVQNVSIKP